MNGEAVKRGVNLLRKNVQDMQEATCWYFSDRVPEGAFVLDQYYKSCMIELTTRIQAGGCLCFAADQAGCSGASCYLGFSQPSDKAGRFLCEVEGYKKSVELGEAFYEALEVSPPPAAYIVWHSCDAMPDEAHIEVVNLWGGGDMLSDLVTIANYDRRDNQNVTIPFAAGCQSLWTIPFQEQSLDAARGVVGCLDPSVRRYLAPGMLSFSVPAQRFLEIIENIPGSFLDKEVFPDT